MNVAKEYLLQIHKIDVLIEQKIKQRDELVKFSGISGINYSSEKVCTSPNREAPFVRNIEKIIKLETEIDKTIDSYVDLKNKIIGQIHEMKSANYIMLLYKRYVEYKSFEEIAVEMHYSFDRIRHIHGEALKFFNDTYLNVSTQ